MLAIGRKAIDISGMKFGRLTVLSRTGSDSHGTAKWNCVCDCGKLKTIRGDKLRTGEIMSCGCLQNEIRKQSVQKMIEKNRTHGMSYDRLYQTYENMIRRCYDPNVEKYQRYGGRGIRVCEDWLSDKQRFFDWAIVSGYSPTLTIDRIDVNGDYSPDNCRWATQREQANNRSTNRILRLNNASHTISEWSDIVGISSSTISARLRRGWSEEKSLTTPLNRNS